MDVANLTVRIGANTRELDAALGKVPEKLKSLGNRAAAVGKTLTLGVTTPLLGIAGAAVKVAADYERASNVFQSVSGATARQMATVSATAQRLGADLTLPATSASDAMMAMLELNKAGLSLTDTMAAARGVLQMSAAAGIENAQAAEIAANALNAFHLAGSQAGKVADLLAAAAASASGEVTDIADAMQMASAVFHQGRQSIESLTTSIGLMANAGIQGSDAGTSLKQMMLSLMAPTDDAASVMNQYGIHVRDAEGHMKSMVDLVTEFSGKLGGLSDAQRDAALKTIFGTDAVRAAGVVLMGTSKAFEKMEQAVTKQGEASKQAGAKNQGLLGSLDALRSSLETLALSARPYLDTLASWALRLADLLNKINALPGPIKVVIINIGAFLAVVGPVVSVSGKVAAALGTLWGWITKLLPLLRAVPLLFTPWGAAIAAVTAVVGALYLAWRTNFLSLQDLTKRVWDGIKTIFRDMKDAGRLAVEGLAQGIRAGIKRVTDAAAAVGRAVVGTVRSVLGIHSPSKEADLIGREFWRGLVQGVQNGMGALGAIGSAAGKALMAATTQAVREAREQVHEEILRLYQEIREVRAGEGLPLLRAKYPDATPQQLQAMLKAQQTLEALRAAQKAAADRAATAAEFRPYAEAIWADLLAAGQAQAAREAQGSLAGGSEVLADLYRSALPASDAEALAVAQGAGAAQALRYAEWMQKKAAEGAAQRAAQAPPDYWTPTDTLNSDTEAKVAGELGSISAQATRQALEQVESVVWTKWRRLWSDLGRYAGDTLHQAGTRFVETVLSGTGSIKDAFGQLLADIKQMVIRMVAEVIVGHLGDALKRLTGGLFGGRRPGGNSPASGLMPFSARGSVPMLPGMDVLSGILSGILSGPLGILGLLAGLFGKRRKGLFGLGGFLGFLADGGPATAGQSYLVGERGPELFVPRQSGTIVPHEALGAAPINVTVHIGSVSRQVDLDRGWQDMARLIRRVQRTAPTTA